MQIPARGGDRRSPRRHDRSRPSRWWISEPLVDLYAARLRVEGVTRVEQGIFGANMLVEIANDGPVTILLDTATLGQQV